MDKNKHFAELNSLTRSADKNFRESFRIKNFSNEDIILMSLYQRMISGLDAVNHLIEGEFLFEATVIVRSLIENTMVINSLFSNPSETVDWLNKHHNNSLEALKNVALKYPELRDDALKHDFSNLNSEYISIKKFSGLNPINKNLYEVAYKMMCDATHVNIQSIDSFIDSDYEVILGVLRKPKTPNFEVTYFTLFYCFFLIYNGLSERYQIILNEVSKIEKILEALNWIVYDKEKATPIKRLLLVYLKFNLSESVSICGIACS